MTPRRRSIPLGIDVGCTRVRVALIERDEQQPAMLIAVASRPLGDDPGAALADAVAELPTSERRCVLCVDVPDAHVRRMTFPPMRAGERERAARFEAQRFVPFPLAEAVVRVEPDDDPGVAIVGTASRVAIARLTTLARQARLRPAAIDHGSFALRRAFPDADAIADIGHTASTLVFAVPPIPATLRIPIGGETFTEAIATSLGIDLLTAERRKCTHGIAGAGDHVRTALVERIASALIDFRASGAGDVRRLVLTGNGARLDGIAVALQDATGVAVEIGTLGAGVSRTLPADVVRAGSPDWARAYGLARWACTA
jgi:Tfp pilus assembly PilM family ATPase